MNTIQEGNCYELIDFKTAEAFGKFRPVSSNTKIILIHTTAALQIFQPLDIIPLHKFELKTVADLCDNAFSLEAKHLTKFSPGH